jgi:hypothetical protein
VTTDVREAGGAVLTDVGSALPGIDAPDASGAPAPFRTQLTEAPTAGARYGSRWARLAPLLLVAFAVGFSAWMLRSELRVALYPNDAAGHDALVRFAAQRIRAGHNPFDVWYPYLGLGAPHFTQYQALPHIITGALSVLLGGWIFRAEGYVLLCTLPISVYIGARLLGLDRWEAGAAALFSPMLSNITGYGIEWKSFVWSGSGMWSMLWGIWLLPIALGLSWRAVAKGERVALAAFVVGLTCAVHFMTGYLVLLAFIVFVLVQPPDFVYRLGRSAIVGLGGLAIFAFVFVPALEGMPFVNVNAFERGTYWFDSYGPHQVMSWLVRGEVFDHDRLPVVSLLVLVGAIVCATRARRHEAARVPLGLLALSLALYSGRSVVGPVVNYLPGGGALFLHRYIMGVHLAGLLLAGIGSVWAFRFLTAATHRVLRTPRDRALGIGLCAALAAATLVPVLADRAHLASENSRFLAGQAAADSTAGRDVVALVDIAKQRGDGRIYAGASNNWGAATKVDQLALYMFPIQLDADAIGLYSLTNSLSSDVEPFFNDTKPSEYDLFDAKYVLVPSSRRPGVSAARLLARRGNYSLYEVPTSGYLEVVDTTAPVAADRDTVYAMARPYIASPAVAQLRHPFVSFNGSATPAPSISSSAPHTGPPGKVEASHANLDDGRFTGAVQLSRPGWVMLKESYAPHWTATVDGKRADTQMLAPSFVGVAVPAGTHRVVFAYKSESSYPLLFTIGALTLLGLVVTPWAWRRRRASRSRAPRPASQ